MSTDRETKARIKNFTPLLDDLVHKYGVITAAVWGRVWRYTQQENGVCQASLDKIADELQMNRRTVIRHLEILTQEGYLFDHTPELRNKPHTYAITAKASILITVEGVTQSHSNMPDGVTLSHSAVTLSHSHSDSKSHEETIKKQIKKQIEVEIPDGLNTPDFLVAWGEWEKYRAEIKHKLTDSTRNLQLKKLAENAPEVAAAMIRQSIEHGWQGIFALKGGAPAGNPVVVRNVGRNEDGSFNV